MNSAASDISSPVGVIAGGGAMPFAVADSLSRRGIAPERLTAFGAGMAAPVAINDDEAGRAKNRRVELVKR